MLSKGTGKTREELRLERMRQQMVMARPDKKPVKMDLTSKIDMKQGLKPVLKPFNLNLQPTSDQTNPKPPKAKRTQNHITIPTGETFTKEEWRQALIRKSHQKCYGLKNGEGKCVRCLRDLNNYDIKLFHLECGPCRREKEEGTSRFSFFLTNPEVDFIMSKYEKQKMTSRGSYVINIIRELMDKEGLK